MPTHVAIVASMSFTVVKSLMPVHVIAPITRSFDHLRQTS